MGGGRKISETLLAQLHPLEVRVLPYLKDGLTVTALAKAAGMQDVEAMRACQWLENKQALRMEHQRRHELSLDMNGKKALKPRKLPPSRILPW